MRTRRIFVIMGVLVAGVLALTLTGLGDPSKAVKQAEKPQATAELNWVKYDAGLKLAEKSKKPILIDFYTNWCGFCKKMDRETFSNEEVAAFLKKHFVTVRVNAESRDILATPQGDLSETQLAKSFGVRGYPTFWFLKADGERINYSSGYSPPNRFIHLLRFIGERHYENETWSNYLNRVSTN